MCECEDSEHADVGRPSVHLPKETQGTKTLSVLLRVSQNSSGKAQEWNPGLPTPGPGVGLQTSFHT